MSLPTIAVGSEEVSLDLYFEAIDLWSAGLSPCSIVAQLGSYQETKHTNLTHDTVVNIIFNQEVMRQNASVSTNRHPVDQEKHNWSARISTVSELADLDVANMVARKREKEKLGLKQFISRLK